MDEGHCNDSGKAPPDPSKPDKLLDSIICASGPFPPARLRLRGLAFALDCLLVLALALIVVWQIVMPQAHPGAFRELMLWADQFNLWLGELGTEPPPVFPAPNRELLQALRLANELQLLIFWFYFAAGEAFFAGSSLGKRICRIRSISTITLGPPPLLSGLVRGGLKTLLLFWLFPLLFAANFMALLFNKRKQLGHDWFSRTAVVDEKQMQLQTTP